MAWELRILWFGSLGSYAGSIWEPFGGPNAETGAPKACPNWEPQIVFRLAVYFTTDLSTDTETGAPEGLPNLVSPAPMNQNIYVLRSFAC